MQIRAERVLTYQHLYLSAGGSSEDAEGDFSTQELSKVGREGACGLLYGCCMAAWKE